MTVYGIGDRCPDCGLRFRELGQLFPTQEEYDAYGVTNWIEAERTHIIVCPNGHEHEPHPDWLKLPYPTVFPP